MSALCNLRMTNSLTKNDPGTYAIIGAAMEVHRGLGCGFLEPVHQKALAVGSQQTTNPFTCAKQAFRSFTKEVELNVPYSSRFYCFDNVVVELKALAGISGIEESQVINYRKVTGYETGLLLNFGARSLEYRRFILTKS